MLVLSRPPHGWVRPAECPIHVRSSVSNAPSSRLRLVAGIPHSSHPRIGRIAWNMLLVYLPPDDDLADANTRGFL